MHRFHATETLCRRMRHLFHLCLRLHLYFYNYRTYNIWFRNLSCCTFPSAIGRVHNVHLIVHLWEMPSGHVYVVGRYVSIVLVFVWIAATVWVTTTHGYQRRIDTRADIGSIVAQQDILSIWIQGSESLQRSVDYNLFAHVTFLDSWSTLHAGLLTFRSDFRDGSNTITSILPRKHPPFIWILRRLFMCPLYVLGVMEDTIHADVLLSDRVRYEDTIPPYWDIFVHPVCDRHVQYIVHVQVTFHRHLPDIVSVSAWYQASSVSWYSVPVWYLWYIWYIGLSCTTVVTLVAYTTYCVSITLYT